VDFKTLAPCFQTPQILPRIACLFVMDPQMHATFQSAMVLHWAAYSVYFQDSLKDPPETAASAPPLLAFGLPKP
jgi:hypothetical protein